MGFRKAFVEGLSAEGRQKRYNNAYERITGSVPTGSPVPSQPQEQMVKTYRSGLSWAEKKFAKDAAKLAKLGWRVQTQSAQGYRWYTRRADSIIVTYVK